MGINIQESPNENIKRNTFRTGIETEFGSRQNCVLGDEGWYGDQTELQGMSQYAKKVEPIIYTHNANKYREFCLRFWKLHLAPECSTLPPKVQEVQVTGEGCRRQSSVTGSYSTAGT